MLEDIRDDVLEKEAKRFKTLLNIYDISGGILTNDVCPYAHEDRFGMRGEQLIHILEHLEREGLIESIGSLWNGYPAVQITHQGIIEIEKAIKHPNVSNQHFSSTAITLIMNQTNINAARDAIGNISSSQVNAPVTNTVSYSESDTSEILQAIAELRQQINTLVEENQDVATDALDTLESEVKSPTKPTKLKTALFSLWGIAQGIASFANSVTAIADRFGVKFHQ